MYWGCLLYTSILGARILVMGMTFKENVADIRNSKVVDIINELKDFGVEVDVVDPYADPEEVKKMYGFRLIEKPLGNYDAVVVAVAHDAYQGLDEKYFKSLTCDKAVLVAVSYTHLLSYMENGTYQAKL